MLVVFVIMMMGVGGGLWWMTHQLGSRVSIYVAQRLWGGMILNDGGLDKFRKVVDTDDKEKYIENTYEVPGFILSSNDKGEVWLLTLYGIYHFSPLTGREVLYLTLDQCIEEKDILKLWQKEGNIILQQAFYPTFAEWQAARKQYSRPFVAVSYLAEDDTKSVKYYRHIHASDGLLYYNVQTEKICPI